MTNKRENGIMRKVVALITVLMLFSCGYDRGECVLVVSHGLSDQARQGEYLYSSWARHWIDISGEIESLGKAGVSIASCKEILNQEESIND